MIDRLNAALEGRYRIDRELGAGGMATVYLAGDLKHRRRVALKVLKPELAAVVGAERFLAEIETTANLQHPHILPLYDSGEADSFLFYVMPYVEGDSLRERLQREHQLPLDEALEIVEKVAAALQYAHEQGVVHRDIKPANILLSRGEPLVADFGIALALSEAGGGRITETGLSLGTPHYMSPEQAAGERTLDRRSDVYALGCVLYEMLTGQPPYSGPTAQSVLAQILTGELVPPTRHRKAIPVHVEHAILRALERLPADRFESADAFVRALRSPSFRHAAEAGGVAIEAGTSRRWRWAAVGAGALAVVLLGLVAWLASREVPPDPVIRYALELPSEQALAASEIRPRIALSNDGSTLAYVGEGLEGTGQTQLWVRRRDELEATSLAGTADAHAPFFSPDGSSLGYVGTLTSGAQGLVVASLSGRPPVVLVDSAVGQDGGAWGDDGFIYYDGLTAGGTRGIMRVRAAGGPPEPVTRVDTTAGETDHVWPQVLPGSRAILYTVVRSGMRDADIAVLDLETGEQRLLVRGVTARYAATGHLLYVTLDGTVMAVPFDPDAMALTGDPVTVLRGLNIRLNGSVDLAVSATGRLGYFLGAPGVEMWEAVHVDRRGRATAVDPDWPPGDLADIALSPDGQRLALSIGSVAGERIWVKELPRGPLTRLTTEPILSRRPTWTPDGEFIAYEGGGVAKIVRADGSSPAPGTLLERERRVFEVVFADGGETIVFREGSADIGEADIGYVARGSDGDSAELLLASPFNERAPDLSPDGRWLAYVSDAGGRDEIFVRPFPDARARRIQVSTSGGTEPLWSHSGEELFYRDLEGWMRVASVSTDPEFRIRSRERLFDAAPYRSSPPHRRYDVTGDDQTFIMLRSTGYGQTESGSLVVVENFFRELRAIMERR